LIKRINEQMKTLSIIFLLVTNALTANLIFSKSCIIEEKSNFLKNNKIIDEPIKGYYNNDDLQDYIIKDSKNKKIYSIYINNGKGYTKKTSFIITKDDFDGIENPLNNLYISNPEKGVILIGASCCGNFKTTEINYYKFFDEINNWILYKNSSSVIESDFIPTIELNYLDYSYLIDGKLLNKKGIKENETIKRKKKNEDFFNILFNKCKKANDNNSIEKTSANLNFDDLAELLYTIPINKDNINNYNDLAYYIGLCNDGKTSSVFLLKCIINKYPTRTVAYLNLGDAQWGLEDKQNAKKSYKKYIELMKTQGKDLNKIPKRVYDRIK
jgi:hypothetical protein